MLFFNACRLLIVTSLVLSLNVIAKSEKTGLLHRIPLSPTELYFDKRGPLSCINQGVAREHSFPAVARPCKIYKHFATRGLFDVVKYDNHLARLLADLKCKARGISQEESDLFYMREVEELSRCHVFYLLADIRDPNNTSLADPNCGWHMSLQIENGRRARPESITEISPSDFDAERRGLFGPNWDEVAKLKALYRVTFARHEGDESKQCASIFSAPDIEDFLVWSPAVAQN